MKYRESGMPSEALWETFFNPEDCLRKMGVTSATQNFLDIGCGYGTFLFPAARIISGVAVGIDIDRELVAVMNKTMIEQQITNVEVLCEDISSWKSDDSLLKYKSKMDFIAMFNILHCEQPQKLLLTAKRLLSPNGFIGVTHWKYEETPRGPSMEIRPKPEQIIAWASEAGLKVIKQLDLPPYHYGLVFNVSENNK